MAFRMETSPSSDDDYLLLRGSLSPGYLDPMEDLAGMARHLPNYSADRYDYTCYYTLDDAQLAARCPLDNGRHTHPYTNPRYSAGQLDRLRGELLLPILLSIDILSLTRLRSVNRYVMELVDSIPEYAAMIKYCPDVIRAIISIQADAFDCRTLYTTLGTSRCSTCKRFGDYLYLITCRRVCYYCFTKRPEYSPLTLVDALDSFSSDRTQQQHRVATSVHQRLREANPPSVLSLPGQFGHYWLNLSGEHEWLQPRLRLFDRRSVVQDAAGPDLPRHKTMEENMRFMAIITAPYLFDFGRGLQADWGYFCLGCKGERMRGEVLARVKYTRLEAWQHIMRCGAVKPTGCGDIFKHAPRMQEFNPQYWRPLGEQRE